MSVSWFLRHTGCNARRQRIAGLFLPGKLVETIRHAGLGDQRGIFGVLLKAGAIARGCDLDIGVTQVFVGAMEIRKLLDGCLELTDGFRVPALQLEYHPQVVHRLRVVGHFQDEPTVVGLRFVQTTKPYQGESFLLFELPILRRLGDRRTRRAASAAS